MYTSNIRSGTYIFFAAWLVLAFAFYWFFVPETRGKTLEEMDAAFGSHSSEADIQRLARIQAEVGLTRLLMSDGIVMQDLQHKRQELATHVEKMRSG